MKKKKKIVLSCSLDQGLLKQLEKIKNYGFSPENSDMYLVHVFQNQIYSDGMQTFIYPSPHDADKIAASIKDTLSMWKDDYFSHYKDASNIVVECLFDMNPKEGMISYLKKIQANLVVAATEGRQGFSGFFHSSFTDYLVKHAPCDVLIFRNH